MRLVVDTNVIISALLFRSSTPAAVIDLVRHSDFDLIASESTMRELQQVLLRPKLDKWVRFIDRAEGYALIAELSEIVHDLPTRDCLPGPPR